MWYHECLQKQFTYRQGSYRLLQNMGGARGGLEGAIAPRRSMLAPRRKVKRNSFGDFWHLQHPKNYILAPSSEESAPRRIFLVPTLLQKISKTFPKPDYQIPKTMKRIIIRNFQPHKIMLTTINSNMNKYNI